MSPAKLNDMTVAEVMERWPDSVQVFNRRRMACPGCLKAPIMAVADASGYYAIEASVLAADLAALTDAAQPPDTLRECSE